MKVLFVCKGNVGRSQAAMEYYKELSSGETASAGTMVNIYGQRIGDREGAKVIIAAMKEHGIDMPENKANQINEEIASRFDKIIVFAKDEPVPEWLKDDPKTEIWPVEDIKGKPIEEARILRDQIKQRVRKLLAQTKDD